MPRDSFRVLFVALLVSVVGSHGLFVDVGERTVGQVSPKNWVWFVDGTAVASVDTANRATPWLAMGHRIPLNRATAEELQQVAGIGPVRSTEILRYRSENGAFCSVSELDNVRGIGEKTVLKVAPFLDVGVMSGFSPATRPAG